MTVFIEQRIDRLARSLADAGVGAGHDDAQRADFDAVHHFDQAVGGMDELAFPVAFNDVDFCLRVRQAGYRNISSPYAELYHHESATRGTDDTPEKRRRFAAEAAFIEARWAMAAKPTV